MSAVAHPLRNLPIRHDAVAGPFGLALLMHALLFAAMTLAVRWHTQPSAPIVAELWSALPPTPAPEVVVAPPPPPPPPPQPQPKPEPEPEKPADIALEQKKPPPKPPEVKKEEPKKPEPKKEEKKVEPKKVEPKKVEPRKTEAKKVEPPRPPTDLERIMAQAQATAQPGAPTVAGASAAGSTVRGADATYAAQVIGCIRPNIVFSVPEGTSPNVYADYRVELMPDASVASVKLLHPSGLPNYDAAAERAIRRCDPFPRKRDGTIDRTIDVRMYPVEAR